MSDGDIAIVCGGRRYANARYLNAMLDNIWAERPIRLLIDGGCTGADALAKQWALYRDVPRLTVEANWDRDKHAAGPIRNSNMANAKPDIVIAFPGGTGTADMVAKGERAGAKIIDLRDEPEML